MKKFCLFHFSIVGIVLLHFMLACCARITKNITTDQLALLDLRARMTSNSEPINQILAKNWSVESSVCDWIGVTCGPLHFRVTGLDISNMSLTGTVSQYLGNLSFLVSLDMSNNNFQGELPQDLARLRRLKHLDFAHNNLGGDLPSWIGSLNELQYLSLLDNRFTGSIPTSISNVSNLETLWLALNSLQGTIPMELGNLHNLRNLILENNFLSGSVPSAIFNISSLEIIALLNNSLSGIIPADICSRLQRLKRLNLSLNKFSGQIPSALAQCSELNMLSLSGNQFIGVIPKELGNFTGLTELYLGNNFLEGTIPDEICNLNKLNTLNVEYIGLTGSIPVRIFNISTLELVLLNDNNFTGILPSSLGLELPNLEGISFRGNELYGMIPPSITNSSLLKYLNFGRNKFSGPIPNSLGDLRLIQRLHLFSNNLTTDPSSQELSFMNSLTNCRDLTYLSLNDNPLNGVFPKSVQNLSNFMEEIFAYNCQIKGSIPDGFGNLSNLFLLSLFGNQLTGSIPATLKGLQNLQALDLSNNLLDGPIPENLCDLNSLTSIYLGQNRLTGSIPSCLANITYLRSLIIAQNLLNSSIPASLWNLSDLLELDLSSNSLTSSLPQEIQNLRSAVSINLSVNHISGYIPSTIGRLQNLVNLSLAQNRLEGPIPDSLRNMLSLQFLDLSYNNLSGSIPKSLEALSYLKYINLSFNELRGEIPSGGPFVNFTSQSFMSNDALCGAPRFLVPSCSPSTHKSSRKKIHLVIYTVSAIAIAAAMIAVTLAVLFVRHRRNKKEPKALDLSPMKVPGWISYHGLLKATDGYSESNLLGTGSFGSVYKGTLTDGMVVAVKVFNLQFEGIIESFVTECEVLRNLRHRNLTKVISSCANLDFKALVFEYMSNGSLENWLYSQNKYLDLGQRLNIMIDVACALEYLHHGYTTPIVHRDLKPSNILLDGDMVGHVCDFGLAKMLAQEESDLHTKMLATLGYIAPEYGSEGLVSTRSDVYSFGIVLMETISRMKPSDEMFSGDLSLKKWVEESLRNAITSHVIDANLLSPEDKHFTNKLECISLILELALKCCKESPRDRINMKDVVASLNKIKHELVIVCGS